MRNNGPGEYGVLFILSDTRVHESEGPRAFWPDMHDKLPGFAIWSCEIAVRMLLGLKTSPERFLSRAARCFLTESGGERVFDTRNPTFSTVVMVYQLPK